MVVLIWYKTCEWNYHWTLQGPKHTLKDWIDSVCHGFIAHWLKPGPHCLLSHMSCSSRESRPQLFPLSAPRFTSEQTVKMIFHHSFNVSLLNMSHKYFQHFLYPLQSKSTCAFLLTDLFILTTPNCYYCTTRGCTTLYCRVPAFSWVNSHTFCQALDGYNIMINNQNLY